MFPGTLDPRFLVSSILSVASILGPRYSLLSVFGMPSKTTSETLKKLDFFAGLPETLVWHLARAVERRELATDERLFEEGQPRDLLTIILSGRLAIEHDASGQPLQIASLGAGEVIGESILLEDGEHSSTGRALEPTEVLFFRKTPLMKLLKDQPALYAALLGRAARIMSARIRNANARVMDTRTDWVAEPAIVRRWLDAVVELADAVGYEKAVQTAREAVAAGRDVKSLSATTPAR
jgi:CRP-like cAMP-binding protein